MIGRLTTRPLVCLLVLSLCAPLLAIASPLADRDEATEFRALAAPASTVLLSRAGDRNDPARQRSSAPSAFTLVPLRVDPANPGHFARAVEGRLPRPLWSAGPCQGRAPPAIS